MKSSKYWISKARLRREAAAWRKEAKAFLERGREDFALQCEHVANVLEDLICAEK